MPSCAEQNAANHARADQCTFEREIITPGACTGAKRRKARTNNRQEQAEARASDGEPAVRHIKIHAYLTAPPNRWDHSDITLGDTHKLKCFECSLSSPPIELDRSGRYRLRLDRGFDRGPVLTLALTQLQHWLRRLLAAAALRF